MPLTSKKARHKWAKWVIAGALILASPIWAEDYGQYFSVAREANGDVIPSATVTVHLAGTSTLASIYSVIDGSTPKGNPFLTDAQGNYFFFIEPGLYKVTVNKIGIGTVTTDNIPIGTQTHASRHEDGGEDELSVEGLSGTLAGAQPVEIEEEGVSEGDVAALNLVDTSTVALANSSGDITATVVDLGITEGKLASDAVTTGKISDGTIVNADVSGSAAIVESKLSLNFATHANTNDPSAGQKAALAGTFGTPGGANQYVTTTDPRMTDDRDPTAHAASHEDGGADEVLITTTQLDGVNAGTDLTADLEEEAHASEHENGGADEISVAGLSGTLADAQLVTVQEDGVTVGTRAMLNFTEGANQTLTVSDAGGKINVQIDSGTVPFESLLGGTNTTEDFVIGTGSTLIATGSGTIAATTSDDSDADDLTDNSIDDLSDVDTTGATDGHVLVFDTGDLVVSTEPGCLEDGTNCPTVEINDGVVPTDCEDDEILVADTGVLVCAVPADGANFDDIGSGTNTTAAMVVGAGGSLKVASTGTIDASCIDADGDGNCEVASTPGTSLALNPSDDGSAELTVNSSGHLVSAGNSVAFYQSNGSTLMGRVNSSGITVTPAVLGGGSQASLCDTGTSITVPSIGVALSADGYPCKTGIGWDSATEGVSIIDENVSLVLATVQNDDRVELVGCAHLGALATAPTTPAPVACDTYFDTVLDAQCTYDGAAWECEGDLSNNSVGDLSDVNLTGVGDDEALVWVTDEFVSTPVCSDLGCTLSVGAVFNEAGSDSDTRIEGDSLDHMIVADASAATENIGLLSSGMPNWQSMDRGLYIGQATTVPSGNPADGVFIWAADTVAGQTNLYARNEQGNVAQLTGLGTVRLAAQFDTTEVTLADVTGFTFNLESGLAYRFEIILYGATDGAGGGANFRLNGTATATNFISEGTTTYSQLIHSNIRDNALDQDIATSLGGSPGEFTTRITGSILVDTGGTFKLQLAQEADQDTTSLRIGSTFTIFPI